MKTGDLAFGSSVTSQISNRIAARAGAVMAVPPLAAAKKPERHVLAFRRRTLAGFYIFRSRVCGDCREISLLFLIVPQIGVANRQPVPAGLP